MVHGPFQRTDPGDPDRDDERARHDRPPPRRPYRGDDDDGNGNGTPDWSDPMVRDRHNRRALISAGLGVAVAFLLASVMPQPVVLAAFREILFFGAMGVGLVAALRREPLTGAPVLTGWDRAALMMLVAQVSGLFVDHAAVEEYLRHVQETGQF